MLNSGRVFAGDKGIRELRERNSAPGQEAPALRSFLLRSPGNIRNRNLSILWRAFSAGQ